MFRRHPAIGRKVIVNLFSGNAIEGVMTHRVADQYIVRAAVLHQPGTDATPPADGEIVIDAANVDFIQMI